MTQYSDACPSCGGSGNPSASGVRSCMACGGGGRIFRTSYGHEAGGLSGPNLRHGYDQWGKADAPAGGGGYAGGYTGGTATAGAGGGGGGGIVILVGALAVGVPWLLLQGLRLVLPFTLRRMLPMLLVLAAVLALVVALPMDWAACALWNNGSPVCGPGDDFRFATRQAAGYPELIASKVFATSLPPGSPIGHALPVAWAVLVVLPLATLWLWRDYLRSRKQAAYPGTAWPFLLFTNRQVPPLVVSLLALALTALAAVAVFGQPAPLDIPGTRLRVQAPSLGSFEARALEARKNSPALEKFKPLLAAAQPLTTVPLALNPQGDVWIERVSYGAYGYGTHLRVRQALADKLVPGIYVFSLRLEGASPLLAYDTKLDLSDGSFLASGTAVRDGNSLLLPVFLHIYKPLSRARNDTQPGVRLCVLTLEARLGDITLPRLRAPATTAPGTWVLPVVTELVPPR